jgi:hypothetical protein
MGSNVSRQSIEVFESDGAVESHAIARPCRSREVALGAL